MSVLVYLLLTPAHAADVTVSASVPLSEQYKKRVQEFSRLSIQRKNRIAYISGTISDGVNGVASESYDLIIVSDTGKIESQKRDITLEDGSLSYVFIPERSRSYTLFLINTSHSIPFLIATDQL